MWAFKGIYSGLAKTLVQEKKIKQAKALAIGISITCVFIFAMMGIMMGSGELWEVFVFAGGGLIAILLANLVVWIDCFRIQKCDVQIKNDGFYFQESGTTCSSAFYKIQKIEYYEDCISVKPFAILQKDLLVEGDWDELIELLKKVEASLDTDEPMYQIDEPTTEFFEASVKSKRIYKRFVGEVRMQHAVYEYFVTFALKNSEELEYEVGQELYEQIEEGQSGTLVLISGGFFSFGDGEDVD